MAVYGNSLKAAGPSGKVETDYLKKANENKKNQSWPVQLEPPIFQGSARTYGKTRKDITEFQTALLYVIFSSIPVHDPANRGRL